MLAFLKRHWILLSCVVVVVAVAFVLWPSPYSNTRTPANFSYGALEKVQIGQPQSQVIAILGEPLFIEVWPMEAYRFPFKMAKVDELETLARNPEVFVELSYTERINQSCDYCDVRVRLQNGRVFDLVNRIFGE
jgi:hypothetical protein